MGRRCRNILTKEARLYISTMGMALKSWAGEKRIQPISAYTYVDLWFILPRTNCDAHNYGKVLFDALEVGGIVTNDKFIMPRVMGVWHDSDTQAIVKIPVTEAA